MTQTERAALIIKGFLTFNPSGVWVIKYHQEHWQRRKKVAPADLNAIYRRSFISAAIPVGRVIPPPPVLEAFGSMVRSLKTFLILAGDDLGQFLISIKLFSEIEGLPVIDPPRLLGMTIFPFEKGCPMAV
jgi:hypothetical protein